MQLSSAHKQRLTKIAKVATAGAVMVSSLGTAFVSPAFATQLTANKTTISDSRLSGGGGTGVTYTIDFTTPASSTTDIKQVNVQFCQEAGAWTDTCTAPTGMAVQASPTVSISGFGGGSNTLNAGTQTAANAFKVTTTGSAAETNVQHEIVVTGSITNPSSAGTYYTRVETYSDLGVTAIDDGESAFAVLQKVQVSGRVLESMTFTVGTVSSATQCGTGDTATVSSTTSAVNFGNFNTGTPRIGCQTVSTATNAVSGYATTIREVLGGTAPQGGMCRQTASNCTNDGGAASVAAADVVGDTGLTSTPAAWTNGTTYGLGLNANGAQKDAAFTSATAYRSLFGATPIAVASSTGPTTATNTYVVLKADVSPTQTAGLYQNTLEYVCTATF